MSDSQAALAASLCLVGAMDRLWFHHAVLLAEPISFPSPKSPITDLVPPACSLDSSKSSVSDHEESLSLLTDEEKKDETPEEEEDVITRPTRMTSQMAATGKSRSHSHSPKTTTGKCSKSVITRYSSSGKRLDKGATSCCKTLEDLEKEEVRGFIDLGFRFNKEHISPRMMSVVPGLQRMNDDEESHPASFIKTSHHGHQLLINSSSSPEAKSEKQHAVLEDETGGTATTRPYLSEAWLIKRPDSPLLNVRVRRGYGAADMKKQLKFWARTVASEIHQES